MGYYSDSQKVDEVSDVPSMLAACSKAQGQAGLKRLAETTRVLCAHELATRKSHQQKKGRGYPRMLCVG